MPAHHDAPLEVRTGQGPTRLSEEEFKRRYRQSFGDPAFEKVNAELERITQVAWEAYRDQRKNVASQKAGQEFADPEHEVSVEWLQTRKRIREAEALQRDARTRSRILLISGSPRTDESCPSEIAKTFRLAKCAEEVLCVDHDVDFLDLSRLTSEYGRQIHPCKGCVSTAMPLCHWPCSCYPNYYLGQVHDWMNELYPIWVAAHGVLIITPVHWYQAPSVLKLMIDRLVCADGGNPDPTTTHGKEVLEAKALERNGWPFPKHLAGRRFGIVVHGDAEGVQGLRRMLQDWLTSMDMVPAGKPALVDRYLGYYEAYGDGHHTLDKEEVLFEEVRIAARTLAESILHLRRGQHVPGEGMQSPRQK